MLASVAASPVSRSGPWHARVQPASEPVFQPLMACGCFFTAVPGSGLPAGVCLFCGCRCSLFARPCCLCCPASVFWCLYKRVWRSECRVFVSWIAPCSCQVILPFFSGFLCLHFPTPVSLWCIFLFMFHFCLCCYRPQALSSFPGTFCFG